MGHACKREATTRTVEFSRVVKGMTGMGTAVYTTRIGTHRSKVFRSIPNVPSVGSLHTRVLAQVLLRPLHMDVEFHDRYPSVFRH